MTQTTRVARHSRPGPQNITIVCKTDMCVCVCVYTYTHTHTHCSCRTCSPAAALRRTHNAKRQADVRLQSLSEPHPDMAGDAPCDEEREHAAATGAEAGWSASMQVHGHGEAGGRVTWRGTGWRAARTPRWAQTGPASAPSTVSWSGMACTKIAACPCRPRTSPQAVIASTNCPVRTQHVAFLGTISVLLVVHFRT